MPIKSLAKSIVHLADRSKVPMTWVLCVVLLVALAGYFKPNAQTIYGILESRQYAVNSHVGGLIEKIHVGRGQVVTEGQVLVTLKNVRVEADLIKAKQELIELENQFNTQNQLYLATKGKADAAIPTYLENLSKSIANKNDQVALYQEELNSLILRSPIDGIASEIFCKIGENVAPFTAMITIDDPLERTIKGYVHESFAGEIAVGQTFIARSRNNPSQSVKVDVASVSDRIAMFPTRLQPPGEAMSAAYWGREMILKSQTPDRFKLGELLIITPEPGSAFGIISLNEIALRAGRESH